jgi:hypothetical protein
VTGDKDIYMFIIIFTFFMLQFAVRKKIYRIFIAPLLTV